MAVALAVGLSGVGAGANAGPAQAAGTTDGAGAQAGCAQDRHSQATATQAVAQQTAPAFPDVHAAAAPLAARRDLDMAYGAFQRGFYMTAFSIATRRAGENTT